MAYIRTYYGVPAKRGGRVRYKGKAGVIRSAGTCHPYLYVQLDGERNVLPYHPKDIEYEGVVR